MDRINTTGLGMDVYAVILGFAILMIVLIVYFLSFGLMHRFKMGVPKSRKFWALLPTVIISPIIYGLMVLLVVLSMTYYPKRNFDPVRWESHKEQRYEMSKDLMKSGTLIGKTREEVIELLGLDHFSHSEDYMGYDIGFVPQLFNIDPSVLNVYFKDGKVVRVTQHEN